MEVYKYLSLAAQFLKMALDCTNMWMHAFAWILPLPIQVTATQITPKIAIDNTIDIDHWYNDKCVGFPQLNNFFAFWVEQYSDKSFHQVRRPCLSWMLPCSNHDYFFIFSFRRDIEHWHDVVWQAVSNGIDVQNDIFSFLLLFFIQKFHKLTVGIGKCHWNRNIVFILLEDEAKWQSM